MLGQFTDNARTALRVAFHRRTVATERDVVAALAQRGRGVACRLLADVGVVAEDLPSSQAAFDHLELVALAVEEAQRRNVRYVGTEHVLLALARLPGSVLPERGASAERLSEILSAVEAERQPRHPPLARRLGLWCRFLVQRVRGRT